MSDKNFTLDYIQSRIKQNLGIVGTIEKSGGRSTGNVKGKVYYLDLAAYSGNEFIDKVYMALLGRLPDKSGRRQNMAFLKRGYPKSALVYLVGRRPESRKYRGDRIKIMSYYKLGVKYYLYKIIEPVLHYKPLRHLFEKWRYNYRYRKYE